MRKRYLAHSAVNAALVATAPHADVIIPKTEALSAIVVAASAADLPNYQTWVASLSDQPDAQKAVKKLADGAKLSDDELILLARLLGVWTRATTEASALELLQESVGIPTFLDASIPNSFENSVFIQFGDLVERIATDFDLAYRNVDGRVFEVTLDGPSEDVFGILTHADVVPVDAANWTLDDGTKLDPYKMQIMGNKIYGR